MEANPSSPESIIPRLPKALLVWAIAVVYCGKSGEQNRMAGSMPDLAGIFYKAKSPEHS